MICQKFALLFVSVFLIIIFMQNQSRPPQIMNTISSDRCWDKNESLKPGVLGTMNSQQVMESESVKDFIIYLRGGNKLKEACQQKSFSNYRHGLLYYSVPFLVLSIQTLLVLTFGMVFCVFDSKCPPCKICKRDLQREPYTKEEISYPLCMAVTMGVFTLGAVIFGCIKSSGVVSGFDNSKCDSESIFEKLIYGSSDQNWLGLQEGQQSIKNMEILTRSAVNDMNSLMSGSSDIPEDLDYIFQLIQQFSDRHSSQYIPSSPDLEEKYNQTISQFLSLYFGPPSQTGTSTSNLVNALDTWTNPTFKAIQNINQSYLSLSQRENNMLKVFRNATNILGQTAHQSFQFLQAMEKFFAQISGYLKGFGANYLLFFSFCGSGSLVTIFGGLTLNDKKPQIRYFMHVGWTIQSLLLVIVLSILCVAAPTIVVLVDMSVSFRDMASSRQMMKQYNYFFPQNLTYIFEVCLFDQGDVGGNLNLTKQFDELEAFFLNIQVLEKMNPEKNLKHVNQALKNELILYQKYEMGYFADSPYADERNQQVSLSIFNQLTNYRTQNSNQSDCNVSQDQWVFDQINCTDSHVMGNQSYNYRFGEKLCIPLRSMTEAKVRQRYQNISKKCPNVNESKLIQYFRRMQNFDQQRRQVFQGITEDLEKISRMVNFYQSKLNRLQNQLMNFSTYYDQLKYYVDDKKSLSSKMSCSFLKQEFSNLKNSFGVLFVTPLFFMTISLLVIAFTQLCGSYNTYKGVTRFSRTLNQPLGDIKNKIYPLDPEDLEPKDQSELERTFETKRGMISTRKFRKTGSFRSICSK